MSSLAADAIEAKVSGLGEMRWFVLLRPWLRAATIAAGAAAGGGVVVVVVAVRALCFSTSRQSLADQGVAHLCQLASRKQFR